MGNPPRLAFAASLSFGTRDWSLTRYGYPSISKNNPRFYTSPLASGLLSRSFLKPPFIDENGCTQFVTGEHPHSCSHSNTYRAILARAGLIYINQSRVEELLQSADTPLTRKIAAILLHFCSFSSHFSR